MQVRSLFAVVTLAGLSITAACSDATSVGGNGTLAVRLTDAPFPLDSVKSVDVFVVRVDVKQDDATDSTAANTDATDTTVSATEARDGWQTIAKPDSLIDLLTLQNGVSTALGQASLKAGTYRAMRLVIDPDSSSITMLDGTVLTGTSAPGIQFPSAAQSGIKVFFTQPLEVTANATTTATADFDVGQSFVLRGSSIMSAGLSFKPVVRMKSVTQ
jgi:Domain of unknown function (DUF4382)